MFMSNETKLGRGGKNLGTILKRDVYSLLDTAVDSPSDQFA